VTVDPNPGGLSRTERRRLWAVGLLRSAAAAALLVVLYYVLPLDRFTNVPVALTTGLLILLAAVGVQVWQVTRAEYPGIRAVEALATSLPLFLLLFASAYFMMARSNPANFTEQSITRTDSLYFTVTVFSTVGFGDIHPVSESARLVVTVQELLDLLAIGLLIRVFVGAVRFAKQQGLEATDSSASSGDPRGGSDSR
jgi:hypothetical protein